jgi:accessory gene regulator protein AgrB
MIERRGSPLGVCLYFGPDIRATRGCTIHSISIFTIYDYIYKYIVYEYTYISCIVLSQDVYTCLWALDVNM